MTTEMIITDEISAIQKQLAEGIGQQKFSIWFKNSTRMVLEAGYLKLSVPNQFVSSWIENHFIDALSAAAAKVTGSSKKISLSIEPQLGNSRKTAQFTGRAVSEGIAKNRLSRTRSSSCPPARPSRLSNMSFDNFIVGQSNQLAYNAAKSMFSEETDINITVSSFNPLFIHGGYGLGKTHLMQGICQMMSCTRPEANWLYVSAEDFTNQFVLALKTKKLEAFRRRYRQTDLLAIDDIHFLASKPSTQEEFLHTFNTINMAGKKVVLASDAHPKMITQLCQSLVSRFVSGMVVKIDTPDAKMRYRILEQKAESINKPISPEVLNYVAENIRTNIRELEGALLKLAAYSSLCGEKVTVAMAKQLLAEHISRTDPIVHLADIESAAATYFGITPADIRSSKKDRTVSTARSFSMFLARKYSKMSFPEIGRLMGNKNHATVILACRKVENLLKRNLQVNWKCDEGNRLEYARDILNKLQETVS